MAGKARVRIYPEQVPDNDAEASYLLQEGFEKRLAEYLRGDFGLCGVRAVAEIEFPSSDDWVIVGRLESPCSRRRKRSCSNCSRAFVSSSLCRDPGP